jgi:hypothetical protein
MISWSKTVVLFASHLDHPIFVIPKKVDVVILIEKTMKSEY